MENLAVVMAGGRGERFWPRSRKASPKQCLAFDGRSTMLQSTVARLARVVGEQNVLVVTSEDMAGLCIKQLPHLPRENILIEPVGRNTAPCVALAALWAERRAQDPVLVVSPADHAVKNEDAYVETVKAAMKACAVHNRMTTLGIKPTFPETGYGYLAVDKEADRIGGHSVLQVSRFVEKPDLATAESYLASGNYLWNSGMFFFRLSHFFSLVEKCLPRLYAQLPLLRNALSGGKEDLARLYGQLEKVSLDYGIAEKTSGILAVLADFGWDDVGSWAALERLKKADIDRNVADGRFISVDSSGCIIQGRDKLIVAIGLEDFIVVEEKDAILICAKNRAQDVRKAVEELGRRGWGEYL